MTAFVRFLWLRVCWCFGVLPVRVCVFPLRSLLCLSACARFASGLGVGIPAFPARFGWVACLWLALGVASLLPSVLAPLLLCGALWLSSLSGGGGGGRHPLAPRAPSAFAACRPRRFLFLVFNSIVMLVLWLSFLVYLVMPFGHR